MFQTTLCNASGHTLSKAEKLLYLQFAAMIHFMYKQKVQWLKLTTQVTLMPHTLTIGLRNLIGKIEDSLLSMTFKI